MNEKQIPLQAVNFASRSYRRRMRYLSVWVDRAMLVLAGVGWLVALYIIMHYESVL
jgi:hypothetical protein